MHQCPGGGAARGGGVHKGGGGGGILITAESNTGPQHTEVTTPDRVTGFHSSPRQRQCSLASPVPR